VLYDNLHKVQYRLRYEITKLKSNSTSGPDNIPPLLFKRLKYSLCRPLAVVFNQFISVGAVPSEWKTAIIVPVF